MRRLKLLIEYDGTNYAGWQKQPNGIAIQEKLEEAIYRLTGEQVAPYAAGRTDAGVHAIGQVAHFDIRSDLPLEKFYKGLNFYLPDDIVIKKVEEVSEEFHARYSARSRSYLYLIKTNYSALYRNRAWICFFPLDIKKMEKAAGYFLGEHDFQSFCSTESRLDHYRCRVTQLQIRRQDDLISIFIEANRFVHNMVRAIVGTLVDIGRGKREAEEIPVILENRNRVTAGPTAPPAGLYLYEVKY